MLHSMTAADLAVAAFISILAGIVAVAAYLDRGVLQSLRSSPPSRGSRRNVPPELR